MKEICSWPAGAGQVGLAGESFSDFNRTINNTVLMIVCMANG